MFNFFVIDRCQVHSGDCEGKRDEKESDIVPQVNGILGGVAAVDNLLVRKWRILSSPSNRLRRCCRAGNVKLFCSIFFDDFNAAGLCHSDFDNVFVPRTLTGTPGAGGVFTCDRCRRHAQFSEPVLLRILHLT